MSASLPVYPQAWAPFLSLRREIDCLFDDFDGGFWRSPFRSAFAVEPFWQREMTWAATPAVDDVESEKAYEVTAELPGMDEKNIEVKLSNGNLTIKARNRKKKRKRKRIII
jgi:HSP20 family protein